MGQLRDRKAWDILPDDVVDRLEAWLAEEAFHLEHREWFTTGRSNDPVARVVRCDPDEGDQQLILKFCASDGGRKVATLRRAWKQSSGFRQRHLAETQDQVIRLGGWRAVFMHVAGGDLATIRPLTDFVGDSEFPSHCSTVVRSLLTDWNGRRVKRTARSVAAVLADSLGRRWEDVKSWAESAGIPVAGAPERVRRPGWGKELPNPFTLLVGDAAHREVEDLIIGKAHGDLSGRNILVPTRGRVDARSYVLIDYDRFSEHAPLTRDPMHLLVALALDHFDDFGPALRTDLAKVLVDPTTGNASGNLNHFQRISTAVHQASTGLMKRTGWGAAWTQQCLLSLVGAGLVHLGRPLRTADPEKTKEWCFHLAATATEAYLQACGSTSGVGIPASPPPAVTSSDMRGALLDRKSETRGLRTRLTDGPWGVVVLRGRRGVGKTRLVDAVLAELSREQQTTATLRIRRHDVNPVTRLDVRALVHSVEGGSDPPPSGPPGLPSLVGLEAALRRLGDGRVVIVVDSAENLLDPATLKLVDPDLDDALELLATEPGHRVTVLLVTQLDPTSSSDGIWPTAEDPIFVGKLPRHDFFDYLAFVDRTGVLAPAGLPEEARRMLYDRLQGNPRLAELAYGVVAVAESGLNLSALVGRLRLQQAKDVPAYLTRLLIDGLSPVRRRVVEALAAFATPVPAHAVTGMLGDESPARVRQALSVLAADRVVHQVAPDQYFLPFHDHQLVLSRIPDEAARFDLLHRAAFELSPLQCRTPQRIADLRVHFAELDALLGAELPDAAYEMIEAIDDVLREWNCGYLLLDQREAVQGQLNDDHLEMANDNALADIYLSRGRLGEAYAAYGRALKVADIRRDETNRMRIYANFGGLYWEQNDTDRALGYYELARDEARRLGSAMVQMGALEGIADCHRRRGRYDLAVTCAEEAMALPGSPNYPGTDEAGRFATSRTVAIAIKLARWHMELGQIEIARQLIQKADTAAGSLNGWLRASVLDGQADMLLDQGELEQAEAAALVAVEQALLLHDPVTLLQARTTLCVTYLRTDQIEKARREIERAGRYRRRGRSLIVLALGALLARQTGDPPLADERFQRLLVEATDRVERDPEDFGAWDFQGYAICGKLLDSQQNLDGAVHAFRLARSLTPSTPRLVGRLRFLLDQLDHLSHWPRRLQPAIDALSGSGRE
ncbi:hypothetical protein C6361_08875 [Plantactinospora sp. BC1]|uniref:tetratricopeptide repeat protein n=1 Tax=Plantactinospora sp. BC1 TaxID=2108470 RepID=UPI000D175019|nr:tetratricopeptide repeat protein [Plantactinospora sp. BC1]AVT29587.1 hypothetical protein C6361_08875 [Plantactinospora sp. BC1]